MKQISAAAVAGPELAGPLTVYRWLSTSWTAMLMARHLMSDAVAGFTGNRRTRLNFWVVGEECFLIAARICDVTSLGCASRAGLPFSCTELPASQGWEAGRS